MLQGRTALLSKKEKKAVNKLLLIFHLKLWESSTSAVAAGSASRVAEDSASRDKSGASNIGRRDVRSFVLPVRLLVIAEAFPGASWEESAPVAGYFPQNVAE